MCEVGMELHDRIFVAGHRGLVGSAIVRKLRALGYHNLQLFDRAQLDLANSSQVEQFFSTMKPQYVFDAAARVGGINANSSYPAEFLYQNLVIQNNLIHYSYLHKVKKFQFLGSVCIYPKYAEIPVKESSLLTGLLEPTNEPYAIAKITGIKLCEAYNRQYGFSCVSLMPANLYGPGDNFDPVTSHVIPGMIWKYHNQNPVSFWGDGTARREFLHVDDLADACVFVMNQPDVESAEIINVGSSEEISMQELANMLCDITRYKGDVVWDTDKPNGTPRRPMDLAKITAMGWKNKTSLKTGLENTVTWFQQHRIQK